MARRPSSRTARRPRADAAPVPRVDLYRQITDTIVAQLEAGCVPWVQPWSAGPGTAAVAMPRNAATARAYSGINVMLLWAAGIAAGYATQRWLTFRQALGLGGCVRRGERGTPVVYADRFTPEQERARAAREGEEARSIAFLKQYTVFNCAQCDGLPEELTVPPPPPREDLIEPRFRALMEASGVTIRIGGDRAFYRPADDVVVLPPPEAFHEPVNFHRTAAHELGHASGHSSRLNREMKGRHGSPCYAREELVAEISAAFVCASLGIVPTVRHADYIGSWLEVLREDERAIVRAASHASKAADWLLARLPDGEPSASAEDGDAALPVAAVAEAA
ncbi:MULTISPECIES: ArdC family protein [Methylobacterium]|uniref:ArdC family protein n=1 Tax=Methylobacterium TaxID=407 RepID=UPI0013ED32DB|nr:MULTISPECIES: zincin-like metallopeptidase domain-containing protein [unclassified Methylobacterium]NGM37987.1 DUF1738 domain-containing protein [Methylobacterium sp. DB0501]